MSFLSPWFLAGIAAVALPLWLHLLQRYKRTPQPFSSLMFFERRLQASSKQRRLREFLLLAMRIALLVLLSLAFAQPFITHYSPVAGRRKLTVIAIDRSFSMRYGARLAEAKARAHALVRALGGGDLAQILAVDSHVEALTAPERERLPLHAAIDSIQATDRASSFGEFARVLRVMDASSGMQLDVQFISDMQQTSMPPVFTDLVPGPHTKLSLYKVGSGNPPNWAVESVTAPARVYSASPARVTAVLSGWHTPPAVKTVSLMLDGKVVASKSVALPASGRAEVEFASINIPYGQHRGEIRISPGDQLPEDDGFLFSVQRSDPRKVLFLYANGRARDALYYKAAMESAPDAGLTVEPARLEQATADDLSNFAFVVLDNPGELDVATARALCDYISKGGAVLLAAGSTTARTGHVPLSGEAASFVNQAESAGDIDRGDAALAGVADFKNVQFSGYTLLSPKAGDRVIARFTTGAPLLLARSMGEGRMLIFASSLDGSENDFPLHASFVPFVAQTGRYLAGEEDLPSSVIAGTPMDLRRSRSAGTAADVIGPDGRHELNMREAASALSFNLERDGFYEVQRAGGKRLLLAVDADRRESDLTAIPDETLALWRNTGNTSPLQTGAVERQSRSWSFWRYLLLAALAVALVESIFGARYLKRGREVL